MTRRLESAACRLGPGARRLRPVGRRPETVADWLEPKSDRLETKVLRLEPEGFRLEPEQRRLEPEGNLSEPAGWRRWGNRFSSSSSTSGSILARNLLQGLPYFCSTPQPWAANADGFGSDVASQKWL